MSATPILNLAGVRMTRGDFEVLRGVDWRVEADERWVILGANGSGKTSLLKVVTGYEWPTRGRVEALGKVFGEVDLRELRKSIGWVSNALAAQFPESDPALAVALSGLEASIGLWRDFTDEEIDRARFALGLLGGGPFEQRPWGALSQGERQRTLIARALVAEPRLLILDEPCVGLDPAARESFLEDLVAFNAAEDPPALVLVTHHPEEIPAFVTHALVLREGRTLASGPVAEVLTDGVMTEAFGRACRIEVAGGRYWLRVG